MKIKSIITLSIITAAMSCVTAFAAPEPPTIAVVDVQKVVTASPQVKVIKANQEAKTKELNAMIKKAKDEINKQKDDEKKKALVAKYEKEINVKREAFKKEFNNKIKSADESISKQIVQKATEMGYTMIIPKSNVLYGGDDITDAIIKVIK